MRLRQSAPSCAAHGFYMAFFAGCRRCDCRREYFRCELPIKSRINELAELKAAIVVEQRILGELQGKTWGLELVTYGDGTRGIVLPRGVKVDRTGAVQDGRTAIVIKP